MSAVDRIFGELSDASAKLLTAGDISLSVAIESNARKVLLLSAASYFENKLCVGVRAFVEQAAGNNGLFVSLVQAKAISRQYHTWFQWDMGNANTFFGLFGPEFKDHMKAKVKASEELAVQVKAFLQIGDLRNQLVHNDYATFPIEMTPSEIFEKFKLADGFVEAVLEELKAYPA